MNPGNSIADSLTLMGHSFMDASIFQKIGIAAGVIVALCIFIPIIIHFLSPVYLLFSSLTKHFRESKKMSFGKKYILMPCTFLSLSSFSLAQIILYLWLFVISFLVWAIVIGPFWTFVLTFFFGLAPVAMITAPFVSWYNFGGIGLLATAPVLFVAFAWIWLSKLAFNSPLDSFDDYATPEDFLGYSPQIFLLGALSLQIIALGFYKFKFHYLGNIISDVGGGILLIVSIVSVFIWLSCKKKLSHDGVMVFYKPSIWVYVLGFFITNIIYSEYEDADARIAVIFWLNVFFTFALLSRFTMFIFRKLRPAKG